MAFATTEKRALALVLILEIANCEKKQTTRIERKSLWPLGTAEGYTDMPKNRKRSNEKGAKSIAIRTKHKIGGRKSSLGTSKMSNTELESKLENCRKRDRNKLRRALDNRYGVNEPIYISIGVLEVPVS